MKWKYIRLNKLLVFDINIFIYVSSWLDAHSQITLFALKITDIIHELPLWKIYAIWIIPWVYKGRWYLENLHHERPTFCKFLDSQPKFVLKYKHQIVFLQETLVDSNCTD